MAGFSAVADWRRPELAPPKDRDFALALGPVVVTRDELDPGRLDTVVRVDAEERLRGRLGGFDWEAARAHAVDGTMLRPGDLLVGPPLDPWTSSPPETSSSSRCQESARCLRA